MGSQCSGSLCSCPLEAGFRARFLAQTRQQHSAVSARQEEPNNREFTERKPYKDKARRDKGFAKSEVKAPAERKRLRDWAMDLTETEAKLPRYKVKKRK